MTDAERIEQLEKENAVLREALEKALKEIAEWKRGFRERSKRRSSRAEGKHAASGKRPGRKAGHKGARRKPPKRIDRTVEYPPPARCECGGTVEPTDQQRSTIVEDVPVVRTETVKHVAHVGRCKQCGESVSEPLPGQTPHGQSVARTQVGPNATAMAVSLRFEHHVSLAGIGTFFEEWFGLRITAGGISHLLACNGERAQPAVNEIQAHVRGSAVVGMDETGHRQNGVGGYAWLARTNEASLFQVELSRGGWVAEQMLGSDYAGLVVSDFYGVYTGRDDWDHGYCGAHVVREAKKIAECSPTERAEEFRDRICAWYVDAKKAQMRGNASIRHGLRARLGRLVADANLGLHVEVQRLQARLDQHFFGVTNFLDRRDVPADNNGTERDLRLFAQHRKATGGTRSPRGSRTLARWMSITQTRRKNGLSLRRFVIRLHENHRHGKPSPSVFAN